MNNTDRWDRYTTSCCCQFFFFFLPNINFHWRSFINISDHWKLICASHAIFWVASNWVIPALIKGLLCIVVCIEENQNKKILPLIYHPRKYLPSAEEVTTSLDLVTTVVKTQTSLFNLRSLFGCACIWVKLPCLPPMEVVCAEQVRVICTLVSKPKLPHIFSSI